VDAGEWEVAYGEEQRRRGMRLVGVMGSHWWGAWSFEPDGRPHHERLQITFQTREGMPAWMALSSSALAVLGNY
jgi:hypothetical protein